MTPARAILRCECGALYLLPFSVDARGVGTFNGGADGGVPNVWCCDAPALTPVKFT